MKVGIHAFLTKIKVYDPPLPYLARLEDIKLQTILRLVLKSSHIQLRSTAFQNSVISILYNFLEHVFFRLVLFYL